MTDAKVDLPALGKRLQRYYDRCLDEHGPTARGVDWNSPAAQVLRFRELLRVHTGDGPFSINDYGCGYAALAGFLRSEGFSFAYTGYDINERLLGYGRELYGDLEGCSFVDREEDLRPADYTVASGVFTLKAATDFDVWTDYVAATLHKLDRLSTRGFAFNSLTKYSDPEHMRPDLYYGDPCFFFDYCKRHFSRDVALLHDYGAYEFTIIVRLDRDE